VAGDTDTRARLVGPTPRHVLIPYEGQSYEFALGAEPTVIPTGLVDFLRNYPNAQGGPAFEVEVYRPLIVTEATGLGEQLVVNL